MDDMASGPGSSIGVHGLGLVGDHDHESSDSSAKSMKVETVLSTGGTALTAAATGVTARTTTAATTAKDAGPPVSSSSASSTQMPGEGKQYWAKGTGYGTGTRAVHLHHTHSLHYQIGHLIVTLPLPINIFALFCAGSRHSKWSLEEYAKAQAEKNRLLKDLLQQVLLELQNSIRGTGNDRERVETSRRLFTIVEESCFIPLTEQYIKNRCRFPTRESTDNHVPL